MLKRTVVFTNLPPSRHVSILSITDKQYSNITNFWGEVEKKARKIPLQLDFFSIFATK